MEQKELLVKREKINIELIETALKIADLGRKMYELKEELRVTNIKIKKLDGDSKSKP